jgi:hypothetical protein
MEIRCVEWNKFEYLLMIKYLFNRLAAAFIHQHNCIYFKQNKDHIEVLKENVTFLSMRNVKMCDTGINTVN